MSEQVPITQKAHDDIHDLPSTSSGDRMHDLSRDCWCKPVWKPRIGGPGLIVIHQNDDLTDLAMSSSLKQAIREARLLPPCSRGRLMAMMDSTQGSDVRHIVSENIEAVARQEGERVDRLVANALAVTPVQYRHRIEVVYQDGHSTTVACSRGRK